MAIRPLYAGYVSSPGHNYIGYTRISRVNQSRYSLPTQERIIRRFVANVGGTLLDVYRETGSDIRGLRLPVRDEAFRRAVAQNAIVLVSDITRLTRDVGAFNSLVAQGQRILDISHPHWGVVDQAWEVARRRAEIENRQQLQIERYEELRAQGHRFGDPTHGRTRRANQATHDRAIWPILLWLNRLDRLSRGGCPNYSAMARELTSLRVLTPKRTTNWKPETIKRIWLRREEKRHVRFPPVIARRLSRQAFSTEEQWEAWCRGNGLL